MDLRQNESEPTSGTVEEIVNPSKVASKKKTEKTSVEDRRAAIRKTLAFARRNPSTFSQS